MSQNDPDSTGTILLVEDDDNCRRMIQRTLRTRGWTVCGAVNGREAASVYSAVRPDVVVTDLLMRGGDGDTLIGELQKIDPGVCIVAITGLASQDPHVVRALKGGAQCVLYKPFDGAELVRAIRDSLHPA